MSRVSSRESGSEDNAMWIREMQVSDVQQTTAPNGREPMYLRLDFAGFGKTNTHTRR